MGRNGMFLKEILLDTYFGGGKTKFVYCTLDRPIFVFKKINKGYSSGHGLIIFSHP